MSGLLSRFRHLARDERGVSYAFIGGGFLVFMGASALAIDVGYLMVARAQAQNAADAGALAGAVALVQDSYANRTASGPAVQTAISTGKKNVVMDGLVDIQTTDVTFPVGPTGLANRVRVNAYRTSSRSNPLSTLIAPLLGIDVASIWATATAEASLANAMKCVRPFTIPDRWVENKNPPWTMSSTFDRYYTNGSKQGQVLPNADEYPTVSDAGYAGYNMETDKGLLLTIRAGTGNNIEPSMYFSWAMPGGTGGSWYEQNIYECNTTLVHFGDPITQEPGNMVGPTTQGIDLLLAQDPDAYWNTTTKRVVSTMSPSPRVFPLPLFDPDYYQSQVVNGRTATLRVANWIGFFVVGRSNNDVYGRITPITGFYDGSAGPAPPGSFPRYIRLVE